MSAVFPVVAQVEGDALVRKYIPYRVAAGQMRTFLGWGPLTVN